MARRAPLLFIPDVLLLDRCGHCSTLDYKALQRVVCPAEHISKANESLEEVLGDEAVKQDLQFTGEIISIFI